MRCLNCHHSELTADSEVCPVCGVYVSSLLRDLLPVGHRLHHARYELLYPLGRGGFGVTYLARHRDLDKAVAIKEYFPEQLAHRSRSQSLYVAERQREDFTKGLQRFQREGRLLALFRHPHIVGVEDLFVENETAYLVMEYLEGHTLDQQQAQRIPPGASKPPPLAAAEVQALGAQIVSALQACHAREIYHLDLKPENLMLVDGVLRLIDFGAARPAHGTTSSTLSFTLQYAPLELMTGGQLGPWSDIFELGMLLHGIHSPPPCALA
jgi:serine/threonine protein kinase